MTKKEKEKRINGLMDYKIREVRDQLEEIEGLHNQKEMLTPTRIPLLLFSIKEVFLMDDKAFYKRYEHVYYCPDLNRVKRIFNRKRTDYLEDAVNLKSAFKRLGVPVSVINEDSSNYNEEISAAVQLTNQMISDLKENTFVSSWRDLAYLLSEIKNYYVDSRKEEKEKEKLLTRD